MGGGGGSFPYSKGKSPRDEVVEEGGRTGRTLNKRLDKGGGGVRSLFEASFLLLFCFSLPEISPSEIIPLLLSFPTDHLMLQW